MYGISHRLRFVPTRLARTQQLHLPPNAKRYQTNSTSRLRIDRVTSKLPKSLQKYTSGLQDAPVSHVVAFLVLHELTAIVPLFALFGAFHYTNYAPVSYMTAHFGDYVHTGVVRFEKYFSKKEWFGFGREDLAGRAEGQDDERTAQEEVMRKLETGEQKYKILVEVALAYAITKVLLPVRIVGSVWATPWFAGVMGKVRSRFSRKP